MNTMRIGVALLLGGVVLGLAWLPSQQIAFAEENQRSEQDLALPPQFAKLAPLFKKLGKPQPGDWLEEHPEPGQTFREYVAIKPVRPIGRRKVLYVLPLGDFTETQQKVVDQTTEFMGIYFGLPVKTLPALPLKVIPASAKRVHPQWGDHQILSTYVLDKVLKPRLPADGCVLIALTASDLWPGKGWNFLFGQASLSDRVGVWSIYRNGDPDKSEDDYRVCLSRTIKTATHETGHMFSMAHCTLFECNMCGCNNRAEADRYPLALCPHCLAKLCYATRVEPKARYKKLIAFCKEHDLKSDLEFYEKLSAAME